MLFSGHFVSSQSWTMNKSMSSIHTSIMLCWVGSTFNIVNFCSIPTVVWLSNSRINSNEKQKFCNLFKAAIRVISLSLLPQLQRSHRHVLNMSVVFKSAYLLGKFHINFVNVMLCIYNQDTYYWSTVLFHHKCPVDAVENMFCIIGRLNRSTFFFIMDHWCKWHSFEFFILCVQVVYQTQVQS